MKRLCVLLPLFFVILSCTRDWNNPFETDSDLSHPPLITNIQLDNSNRLMLYLDYSYSSDCTLLFERKSASAFDPVNLLPITTSVYADTTLDMEQNYNLVYRLRVQKNGYTSDYSNEKQFSYVSNVLNAPSELTCSSIELQGVRLNWTDNSNKESGFRIEKNVNGSGFAEAADLPANTTTWLDAISGMPDPPQSIIYRIRAYNNNLNSSWSEQNVIYSGLGAPTNLHVTNSNFWEYTIAWTSNSTIATGYQIERKKDNGVYTVLATVGAAVQTYTTELYQNGSYSFRVKALRNSDSSTYSNELVQQINIVMPTSGLIAYYPFNGNANDESGNENHGVLQGSATTTEFLQLGDNEADCISLPFSVINGLADFSFTARLRIDTVHDYSTDCSNVIVSGAISSDDNSFAIEYYSNSSQWGVTIERNGYSFPEDTAIEDDNWHYITIMRTGSTAYLYIDGVQIGTNISIDSSLLSVDYSGLILGQDQDYLGGGFEAIQSWAGCVDNLRIYNRALNEAEIQALYHEDGWIGQSRKKK